MKKYFLTVSLLIAIWLLLPAAAVRAMPVGTLLFRTSGEGKMYGYNENNLIVAEKGKLAHIYSGHAAIYVGSENGIDYIVEMEPSGAIKVPARYFVNEASGEKLLGAKIPIGATALQLKRAAALAEALAAGKIKYDFDFSKQKGPGSGDFTCVGLTEKVYESADMANPYDLSSLEYNSANYAINITPDGYDDYSTVNSAGDCVALKLEFSKIAAKSNMLIPAPEIFGYDVGLEKDGCRYIFLPYTQFIQSSLKDVPVDIDLASSFSETEIRGESPILGLVLKWSFINNPLSSLKNLAFQTGQALAYVKNKIFPDETGLAISSPDNNGTLVADNNPTVIGSTKTSSSSGTSTAKKSVAKTTTAKTMAAKTTTAKTTASKTTASKTAAKTTAAKTTASKTSAAKTTTAKTTAAKTTTAKNTSSKTTASQDNVAVKATTTSQLNVKIASVPNNTAVINSSQTTAARTIVRTADRIYVEPISNIPIPTQSQASSSDSSDSIPVVNTDSTSTDNSTSDNSGDEAATTTDDIATTTDETTATDDVATTTSEIATTTPDIATATPLLPPLISEIYSRGSEDWLLISNPNNEPFDLAAAGYRLEKTKTAADPSIIIRFGDETDGLYPGGTIIPAHGTYLVTGNKASTATKEKAQAIGTRSSFTWGDSGYTIYLATDAVSNNNDADIVDKVGFGPDATYYEGSGPAPALDDKHILERKATASSTIISLATGGLHDLWLRLYDSNDNSADFLLVPTSQTADLPPDDPDNYLYVPPAGLDSENLTQLWHFDECYGATANNELQEIDAAPVDLQVGADWTVGRWGCGIALSYNKSLTGRFPTGFDPNNFTLHFIYKSLSPYMRLAVDITSEMPNVEPISLVLTDYKTSLNGLPGSVGDFSGLVWPKDDKWHQADLVINRDGGYFALYRDGEEIYRYEYAGVFPLFDNIKFSDMSGITAIDEVAFWNRSLDASEVKTIYTLDQPFNPYPIRNPQQAAKLLYYWNFDENQGTQAIDSVAGIVWPLTTASWDKEGRFNSAFAYSGYPNPINITLPSEKVEDISVSFWWHNTAAPNEGRLVFSLRNSKKTIFEIRPTIYRPSFTFNGNAFCNPDNLKLIPDDTNWHKLVMTYDSYRYRWRLYVDGAVVLERSFIRLPVDTAFDSLNLTNENFYSSLDDVQIWKGALTPKQIKDSYDLDNSH